MADITFVVYEGADEVLVTTPEFERDMLAEYGDTRDWEEFDRTELRGDSVRVFPRSLVVTD